MKSRLTLVLCCLAALGTAQIQPVTVQIGPLTPTSPRISPLIYGANFATPAQALALNLPINRNGGNATTRYNWQQNSTSSAADWYFLSHQDDDGSPSRGPDNFVQGNKTDGVPGGTASMITIPIIGWVAKTDSTGYTWSFSIAKYGAQQAHEPSHPDDGNGNHTNGTPITGNDPTDANMAVGISYQQGWLQHLVAAFGTAANGGVAYYLLDNEPALWYSTHRDVFPTGVTMTDLFNKELGAAQLVKSIDPGAQVCGPEEWGWLGYIYSGYDEQWHGIHNDWGSQGPDQQAHGGMLCSPFLLQSFAAASQAAGQRLLDVYTLHYYPQSNYGDGDTGAAATQWRARATRSLWDPNYVDESWIDDKIDLIPRMHGWVNQYYPGTKIGITEYEWGSDPNMGAAIAQADALGIYGREGVDLATRWVCPATGSVTFKAFQMYRNFDGANGTFGDTVLPTTFPDPDTLSAFGSWDSAAHQMKIMLVHKRTSGDAPVDITFPGSLQPQAAQVYQLKSSGISHLASINTGNGLLKITIPPQSVTLLVIAPRSATSGPSSPISPTSIFPINH